MTEADKSRSELHGEIESALALPAAYRFDSGPVLNPQDIARLALMRATSPHEIDQAMAERKRRTQMAPRGRLVILAADHPARMVTGVGSDAVAMARRADYLARIVHVLQNSPVDGLMATPDILEEVAALCRLGLQAGGSDFLAECVLIGSMNRAGFQGSRGELFDPPSSYLSADDLVRANLDGGKILWRYSSGPGNGQCLQTFDRLCQLVGRLAELKLPVFIEPLAVRLETPMRPEGSGRRGGPRRWLMSDDVAEWMRVVSAAAAMGPTTARSWIKIPFLPGGGGDSGGLGFADVAGSTTLPILMLGGPSAGTIAPMLADFHNGMQAAANVLGALVGRNVLYPGADDPALAARAVCHVVHDGLAPTEAANRAATESRRFGPR